MNLLKRTRRSFIKKSANVVGASMGGLSLMRLNENGKSNISTSVSENPLVLFDNFHAGSRRNYSFPAKFKSAKEAGFDGFEIVSVDPASDEWQIVHDLMPTAGFSLWGLHWTSRACVDRFADNIEKDIEKINEIAEACAKSPIEYISFSLSGNDELRGPTIHESGSAKAEDRHWDRAFKLIEAFDHACATHRIRGALYPHTHWICDTPQSQQKILDGAQANWVGPAFCSHHWYANKSSLELDEAFALPMMKRLNYVVLTNGRFQGDAFPAVRFDLGEIDMAWMLAKIMDTGYQGPISSQGWGIGGDPFVVSKTFVDTVQALKMRFKNNPDLWPLH